MADAPISGLTELSAPSLSDVFEILDVSDTTMGAGGSNRKITAERLFGLLVLPPGGRLTTESGVAVSTSDRSSQSTLYYTPHKYNRVWLYDGTRWNMRSFTERSIALSGLASGRPYDVFLYDNAGTPTLELTAWTNTTTRATALTASSGVWTKSGDTTRLYLGTIYTTGTTTTADSSTQRYVWNAYWRVPRRLQKTDTTASWTYASTTIRQARAQTANRVELVAGLAEAELDLAVAIVSGSDANAAGICGIGEDSTTSHAPELGGATFPAFLSGTPGVIGSAFARLCKTPAIGYHAYNWLENASGATTVTFYGQSTGTDPRKPGLIGDWEC
jgi:hypothetical protein